MKNITDKASGYGYAGPLPSGWHIRQLGAVASEVLSRNTELTMGREHVLSVDNGRGLVPSARKLGNDFSRYKLIRSGHFAYNPMRLNVGSIALRRDDEPAIVSPDYVVFRCSDGDLDPEFFDFYRRTQAWKDSIARSGQGSVRIRYYFHHIAGFTLVFPRLPEQRAIAGVLRTVQAAIGACERVIAATRQLKHSLLAHLFAYGPVPFDQADKIELKETASGLVPAAWPLVPIGQCAEVQTGVAKGRKLNGDEVISVPYLRVANVQSGRLDLSEMKSIELRRRELNRYLLQTGDVALTEGGDFDKLGRGFIWRGEVSPCVHQNHIFAVRADRSRLVPDFLAFFVQSDHARSYFLGVAHKTTNLACINKTKLEALPVLLPSLAIQRQIASQLSAVDAKLAAEEARREALGSLFASLLENLMTGRVRLPEFAGGS
jgi:type I restriction enzyme S subunit